MDESEFPPPANRDGNGLSEEFLQKQAKKLRKSFFAHDPQALATVRKHAGIEQTKAGSGLPLRTVQLVLARMHGLSSWQELIAVTRRSELQRRHTKLEITISGIVARRPQYDALQRRSTAMYLYGEFLRPLSLSARQFEAAIEYFVSYQSGLFNPNQCQASHPMRKRRVELARLIGRKHATAFFREIRARARPAVARSVGIERTSLSRGHQKL